MLKSAKFHTKNLSGLVLGSGLLSVFCFLAQASAATLEFSTYLGSSGFDYARAIGVDGSGNCYVTGSTYANDFPVTVGAYDTSYNDFDAFVTKLNSSGNSLVFSTFLGGFFAYDQSYSISVDISGNCYVTGSTQSIDFPTTVGAYDTSQNGGDDVFVTKLNSDGSSLIFSTYLGGESNIDYARSIRVDGSGNCYVTGYTQLSGFPTTAGAYDTSPNGISDAFVTKLNASGSSLEFSTFLGGSGNDIALSLSLDGSGNCYVTGGTYSTDFPTTVGAFDTSYNGSYDVIVTKINSGGSLLVFSTYVGGILSDKSGSISLDGSGNCYVTGGTYSTDFPTTVGAFDTSYNGSYDVIVTKINSGGSLLVFSTYVGGILSDKSGSISLDGSGNCYVTGDTYSTDFPTTVGAYDTSHNGVYDAFVTKLNSGGSSLVFSTFIGGSIDDYIRSLSVDENGNCYVTGYTQSSDFPTTVGAFDESHNFSDDAFVSKFDFFTGVTEQNNLAKDFQLNQNFPNPFNPTTTISYTLAKTNDVKLEVFNTKGELVRALVSENQTAGSHTSVWNGKDKSGNLVSSGVYFYKLTAGNYTKTNKMILLK